MFDIFISSAAIIVLLPLWGLVSIGIFLEDRGPIFFRQKRLGRDGHAFTLYKFRSMCVNDIAPLALGPIKHNHSLVTWTGYIIRRLKLDETPQFWNVLKGDMSLVGPRPCLIERWQTMSVRERERFSVSPGLSGWAEVNGNVELSWEEQLLLDLWYIKHHSFYLDLIILLKTFTVVLFGSKKNEQALRQAKQDNLKQCAY